MNWIQVANTLKSSYKKNNLGWFFYSLVRMRTPQQCVEIGVLQGYSAIFTLAGLRANGFGKWIGYDLFEDYPYTSCSRSRARSNIKATDLHVYRGYDGLHKCDVTRVFEHRSFPKQKIDFLHVDISNDRDTYKWVLQHFRERVSAGGLVVLEGGSIERDQVFWMREYGKPSIAPLLESDDDCMRGWKLRVKIELFPSLTVFQRVE